MLVKMDDGDFSPALVNRKDGSEMILNYGGILGRCSYYFLFVLSFIL
jgi:hypothetical protein